VAGFASDGKAKRMWMNSLAGDPSPVWNVDLLTIRQENAIAK
jgi:hypothetical protein